MAGGTSARKKTETEARVLDRCRSDLEFHSSNLLKIVNKKSQLVPFVFNRAQREFHSLIEKQKKENGYVRAVVLKSRKEGFSTYVAARFYNHASLNYGVNVMIMAHKIPASKTLYGIVQRYHDNNPIAPALKSRNESEMVFAGIESGYHVAVAGETAGSSRSMTIHRAHLSEVALYNNAHEHFAAVTGAVPISAPGTEVILESTANGPAGEFYERWHKAVAGKGRYVPFFWPWYKSEDNRLPIPEGFERTKEEEELSRLYDLNDLQLSFRRAQIEELGSEDLWRQEFPATPEEAFSKIDGERFIDISSVITARKNNSPRPTGAPVIIGVDPAGGGGDRFAIACRQGNKVLWVRHRNKISQSEAIAWIKDVCNETNPQRLNIDTGGIGAPLYSTLLETNGHLARICRAVNFGTPSHHKMGKPLIAGPVNRRAEMWNRMKNWLESDIGADIPDDQALQADLLGPKKLYRGNDFLLESKADMKKRGVRSSDLADALCLTFAFEESLDPHPESSSGRVADHEEKITGLEREEYDGTHYEHSWMGF